MLVIRTAFVFSSSGRRPEELYWGGSTRRPAILQSVRPFVCLSNCLSVCKHVCRRTGFFFRYLHNLTLKGTFWPSFKNHQPSGLGGDAITRKCLQTDGKTDIWTNGRTPERSPSERSLKITKPIIHTLCMQLQGELCANVSDMRTYWLA